MTEERKSSGRGYGPIHEDATPESVELARYLRLLVQRAGKTQRDLQEPTSYGKSAISSFLSGETMPPQAFVDKLVTFVTPIRQQATCRQEALRLYAAAQRPQPATVLPAPRAAAEENGTASSLASVAATAQDQAAKAHEQLAQAHRRNEELIEERGRTQALVLSLSGFTSELRQQVVALEAQVDDDNEESEARLRELSDRLEAAQRELRRARTSRDETEVLLTRLRRHSDELEEELARSRRTASVETSSLPTLPEELQEASFRADFANALRAAEGFLNDGQHRRDAVSDEWSLLGSRRSAVQTVERLRTGNHLLGRGLGCLAMMSATALHMAASRAGVEGWNVLLGLLLVVGVALVGDPWSPITRFWPVFRAAFRREQMPPPVPVSVRSLAVRAGRCLSAGAACVGVALSVQCSVEWSSWWLLPLLPATAACVGYAVVGLDSRVTRLAQEVVGELGADFKSPPRAPRASAAMGMTSPVTVTDRDWLEGRRQEVGNSLTGGWTESALWIKVSALVFASLCAMALFGLVATTVTDKARSWSPAGGWHWEGMAATVEQPVNAYLAAHSSGLPLPVSVLQVLWVGSGAVALVMSFLFGGFGARLTWALWGVATVLMVWSGTPAEARPVAAGLATIAWGLASILALRGLRIVMINTSHKVVVSNQP
ncbi:helix-turn-helix domain-containing protein [Streptomyces sp. NPDC058426]|uniref:helix-turn-helix domain-containing protein n=1 Tax=Streptomyces sp. NPDC058426 TaxID=3346493 RepID=UPI00364B1B6A